MVTQKLPSKRSFYTLIFLFVVSFSLFGCGSGSGSGDGGGNNNGQPVDTSGTATSKEITSFSIDGVSGTVNETAKSISVTMPNGTDVTALVATFTATGTDVKVGAVSQASGATANDFTNPVLYTVTAADGTTSTYTVTLNIVVSFKLPDTGQTTSYTNTFGEDNDYVINPPSYTDNGNGTITDNVTDLMWQKEDDDVERNWIGAGAYCGDLILGGHSDWRLPEKIELMSIIDYGRSRPSIDPAYFPRTKSAYYWSATTYVNYTSNAWYVYFNYGHVSAYYKSDNNYVRCVRGGQ